MRCLKGLGLFECRIELHSFAPRVKASSGAAPPRRGGCLQVLDRTKTVRQDPKNTAATKRFVKLNRRSRLVNIAGTDHGFGVEDDEDLSTPETKEKHRQVFAIISQFFTESDRV